MHTTSARTGRRSAPPSSGFHRHMLAAFHIGLVSMTKHSWPVTWQCGSPFAQASSARQRITTAEAAPSSLSLSIRLSSGCFHHPSLLMS